MSRVNTVYDSLRKVELRLAPVLFDHIAPSRLIRATYGRAPKPQGEFDIEASGFNFRVRPSKSNVDAALYYHGIYEAGTNDVIRRLLSSGGIFWDVGGYIGLMSALATRVADEVHIFEPHPENLARLQHTVAVNSLDITVHAFGLSDASGIVNIARPGDEGAASMTHTGPGISVPVKTVDNVAKEIGPPDVVKIDVEGWESRVITGGKDVLSSNTAPAIVLESSRLVGGGDAHRTISLLESLNDYTFFVLSRGKESRSGLRPMKRLPRHDNVFCLRPQHCVTLEI